MEHPDVDVAIIGASPGLLNFNSRQRTLKTAVVLGLAGIAFARFYLDTHPKCRLTIFEKVEFIGGVWSASM